MQFATRVKSLRKKERYSQVEFGQMVGVRPNTVWRWENDKAKPDTETIVKIADALNTTAAYLLGETDTPTKENQQSSNEFMTTITPTTKEQSFKVDKGMMTYYFSDTEKIEMPASPELIPLFERMVAERLKANLK